MHFKPPMTMMDFFRKSEGIWFIERNVHHFDVTDNESGESNLIVDVIEPDSSKVAEVCALQNVNPKIATGGASFRWMATTDEKEPNADYAAILIDIPDDESKKTGKLIRNKGYVEGIPVVSRYWFGDDGILTINTDYDNNQGQERAWFINDDFRVRVSSVRMMNGVNLVTYCSERRCVSPVKLEQMLAHHN
ncbi:Chromophore lyase CpcS/CpeS 4 [Hyella patelloides LEGE 07179]|uniref:Chromophore lyase CpcS/CpeS n=1 Tax=Hyella patelloides LEGE 07179 TaxID=945734 RepID=A0A563W0N1_9CYAN|nr:phycobiliprotein lyase [Hyella patelloides]VEP17220.1 Chromophore lyase CpcS/CpeS 4 [Hyella patelloides LEGE 07179]